MPNRKIRKPLTQNQAVWFIKLTPLQAEAFWRVFTGCGLRKCEMEDFLAKCRKTHLRIVENLSPIHYSRRHSLSQGRLECYFEDNPMDCILGCGDHPFYTNRMRAQNPNIFGIERYPKTVPFANARTTMTHAQWVKKLLALG